MSYRRRLLLANQKKARLPSAYQEVTYLRGTGTQYIDTDYDIKSDKVNIKLKYSFTGTRTGKSLFGSQLASNNNFPFNPYGGGGASVNDWRFYIGSSQNVARYTAVVNEIVELECETDDNHHYSIMKNNSLVGTGTYSGSIINGNSVYLFTANTTDTTSILSRIVSGDFYSFEIIDNDIKVRDLVPCYRKSDNEAGMYDLVNDVFYTNAGTGTFIVGQDIN